MASLEELTLLDELTTSLDELMISLDDKTSLEELTSRGAYFTGRCNFT